MPTIAIIAGGTGARTHQAIPKQFINVENKPILVYTLEAFQQNPNIDEICVVILEGWDQILLAYAKQFNIPKLKYVVTGGPTGQESIYNGLNAVRAHKNILVTGATELIGSLLIDVLVVLKQKGVNVTILRAGRKISNIVERFGNSVIPIHYDAMLPGDLPDHIDYIVHGAGLASPELFKNHPVETMLSNLNGVVHLLQYCIGQNTRMVYILSSEVYGQKTGEEPFTETDYGYVDLDNIRNSYSEAKRSSEKLCRAFAKEYVVSVSMIRSRPVYGPKASIRYQRISSDFAFKAAKGDPLELFSSGLQKRLYCYCIVAACVIIVCLLNGKSGEAYNIGTEEVTSIREMALLLSDVGSVELKAKEPGTEEIIVFNPMNNSSLSSGKIREIGFEQRFSVKLGLDHTVKMIKEYMS